MVLKHQFAGRWFNRQYHTRGGRWSYNKNGTDIFEMDWDNLLLADACRFDAFESESTLPGETTSIVSRGSATWEFLRGNISKRVLHDTVYVTANPQYVEDHRSPEHEFHATFDAWNDDRYWDHDTGTVPPEALSEMVLDVGEEFPQKRLFVHFVQPHYPFIDADIESGTLDPDYEGKFFWHRLMLRELSMDPSAVWGAYVGNLNLVLDTVDELAASLEGKTVLTSDHGNMFFEPSFPVPIREWGHPAGIYVEQLVRVPWHEFPVQERRTITSGPPIVGEEVDKAMIEDRLAALGYR